MQVLLPAAIIGSAAVGAVGSYQAGRAEEASYQSAAREEEIAYRQRQIERRRNLSQSLAQQSAFYAYGNLDPYSGTPMQIRLADISAFEQDELGDLAGTEARRQSLLLSGKYARRGGILGAAGAVFTGVSRYQASRPVTTTGGGG